MVRDLNMGDLKGGFAKNFQKHAVRAKEKILQNLGKADKTTDELFNDYENNFNKQQLNANRLHKEISNYLRCARALHGASKALFETLSEVYEPEWVGHDLLYVQAQNSDMLWTDFCHKIADQSLAPLTVYSQDFPEIRKKIDKRGRKLVDYDSQRHQLENLQRASRRDEYKIARVKDQLDSARNTYESLNKELYEELPSLHDERIPNTANTLQMLFSAEATFMQETSKVSTELEAITDKLSRECAKGIYRSQRGSPPKSIRPTPLSSPTSPPNAISQPTVWYDGHGKNKHTSLEDKSTSLEEKHRKIPTTSSKDYQRESRSGSEEGKVGIGASTSIDAGHFVVQESEPKLESYKPVHSDKEGSPESSGSVKDKKDQIYPDLDASNVESSAIVYHNDDNSKALPSPINSELQPTSTSKPSAPTDPTVPDDYPTARDDSTPYILAPTGPTSDPANLAPDCTEFGPNAGQISPRRKHKHEQNVSNRSPLGGRGGEGRSYEDVETDDKKLNGAAKINGTLVPTSVPQGATTEGLPSGVLYRVKATYKYNREDVDELAFEVGEVIRVVEYDDPDEQEEGWLCGIMESTNEKGLFPANFTRPI